MSLIWPKCLLLQKQMLVIYADKDYILYILITDIISIFNFHLGSAHTHANAVLSFHSRVIMIIFTNNILVKCELEYFTSTNIPSPTILGQEQVCSRYNVFKIKIFFKNPQLIKKDNN